MRVHLLHRVLKNERCVVPLPAQRCVHCLMMGGHRHRSGGVARAIHWNEPVESRKDSLQARAGEQEGRKCADKFKPGKVKLIQTSGECTR